ncbi:hypothetical protein DPMN_026616 [Dreissena polymorpha]|uniref:Uncharacterized protein n=1 Tax=Dreissena polymorpha TaxID=45954 RepID=A0A9D4LTR7_DREPO|nr:hypothetical protein DPMN_026616 [Dreissena polymorpha]
MYDGSVFDFLWNRLSLSREKKHLAEPGRKGRPSLLVDFSLHGFSTKCLDIGE